MISWLNGEIINIWQISTKNGVVLNVRGIGYEIQTLRKQIKAAKISHKIELWIHQIYREDGINLYGFKEINQRDLFREIISVNGVGPQIAMALLENFEVDQFIISIEQEESNLLTKTQGIGKRTAERLIVELRNKLHRFTDNIDASSESKKDIAPNQFSKYIDEISSILKSLGYIDHEIKDSMKIITTNEKENTLLLNTLSSDAKAELMDKDLKKILLRLSEKST